MAVSNPLYLRKKVYLAQDDRQLTGDTYRAGVLSQDDMTVDIGSGIVIGPGVCYVAGSVIPNQGVYRVFNDANLTVPIPAPAAQPRIDQIIARVRDTDPGRGSSGTTGTDQATIERVAGAETAGANLINLNGAASTLPANSYRLCYVQATVAAGGAFDFLDTRGSARRQGTWYGDKALRAAASLFDDGFRWVDRDPSYPFDGPNGDTGIVWISLDDVWRAEAGFPSVDLAAAPTVAHGAAYASINSGSTFFTLTTSQYHMYTTGDMGLTAPYSGIYDLRGSWSFPAQAGGSRGLQFLGPDGSTVLARQQQVASSTDTENGVLPWLVFLNAGDTVKVQVAQNSAVDLVATVRFTARMVSAVS